MADQKVIITSTNTNGQTMQKTLTDINPDAGNTELKTFAQMLNGLTDNTYGKTDRVIKYNCDTEAGGSKQTPTLTLNPASATLASVKSAAVSNGFIVNVTYDGDGQLFSHSPHVALGVSDKDENGTVLLYSLTYMANTMTEGGQVIFRTTETDTYKAAESVFTITNE